MPIGINNTFPFVDAKAAGSQQSISKNFERLSSGKRINSAQDDAAGLAISEGLNALTRSLEAAGRNTSRGISAVQTAESGLGEVNNIAIRMRELAVQAADGSLSEGDRAIIDEEFQQLQAEIDRTAETTEFNDQELLSGDERSVSFQVGEGTSPDDQIDVEFGGVSAESLGLDTVSVAGSDGSAALAAIDAIDGAQAEINERRAEFGAANNRLEVAAENNLSRRTALEETNSRIRDTDFAEETSNLARNQVLQQARVGIQAAANQSQSLALNLLK